MVRGVGIKKNVSYNVYLNFLEKFLCKNFFKKFSNQVLMYLDFQNFMLKILKCLLIFKSIKKQQKI